MGIGSGDRREDDASSLAARIADLFAALADGLLRAIRDAVRDALNPAVGPAMARQKLWRRISALTAEARAQSAPIVDQQVTRAVGNARAELVADLPDRPPRIPDTVGRQIALTLNRQLAQIQVAAERATDDAFKQAIGQVMTPRPGISQAQRLENAQKALDDLADRGLTVFTDRAGRRWDLVSYAEMATRTAVSRSLLNIQLTAFIGAGRDAVLVVSRTLGAPCPHCRPWDGKVVSLTGATVGQDLTVTPFDAPPRTEHVVGTLAEAMATGLLHPNCRHALVDFADGVSMAPAGLEPPPAGVYEAEQRQRALERRVREHRRRAAVALPGQQAKAKRRLAAAVKASREHAAVHGIKRQTRRERLGVAR